MKICQEADNLKKGRKKKHRIISRISATNLTRKKHLRSKGVIKESSSFDEIYSHLFINKNI